MDPRKLTFSLLFIALSGASVAADLVLPKTNEEFRQLADGVDPVGVSGRRGVVERVSATQKPFNEPSPISKPGVRESADIVSDRTVIATPVIGVGPGVKKPGQPVSAKMEYSVVVRWDDGTLGVINQDVDPDVRKGDSVVLTDGRIVRVR